MNEAQRKAALRRVAAAKRSRTPDPVPRSAEAADHLSKALGAFTHDALALYHPIRSEADPTRLASGRRTAFPRVHPAGIRLHWASLQSLVVCPPFGIREPRIDAPEADLRELSLVVVPGLAFDLEGTRLGYGRGYYDRLLARARGQFPSPVFVGFGFEAQVRDDVPSEAFDQRLDGLVTENGLRWFNDRHLALESSDGGR